MHEVVVFPCLWEGEDEQSQLELEQYSGMQVEEKQQS